MQRSLPIWPQPRSAGRDLLPGILDPHRAPHHIAHLQIFSGGLPSATSQVYTALISHLVKLTDFPQGCAHSAHCICCPPSSHLWCIPPSFSAMLAAFHFWEHTSHLCLRDLALALLSGMLAPSHPMVLLQMSPSHRAFLATLSTWAHPVSLSTEGLSQHLCSGFVHSFLAGLLSSLPTRM